MYYQYTNAFFANILIEMNGYDCFTFPNNIISCEKVEYLEDSYYEYIKYKNYGRTPHIDSGDGYVYNVYPFTDDIQHVFTINDFYGSMSGSEPYKNNPVVKINRKNSDKLLYEVKSIDLTSTNPILYYCKKETDPIYSCKTTQNISNNNSYTYDSINFKLNYGTNISKLYTIIDNYLVEYYKEFDNSYIKFNKKNTETNEYKNIASIYSVIDITQHHYDFPVEISDNTITLEMVYSDIIGIKNIPNFDKDSIWNSNGIIEFDNGIILNNISFDSEIFYYPVGEDSVFIEGVNEENTIKNLLNKYNLSNKQIDIVDYYKYLTPTNIPGFNNDKFNYTNKEIENLILPLKIDFTKLRRDYDNVDEIKKPFNLNLEIIYDDDSNLIQLDNKSLLNVEIKIKEIKSEKSIINFSDIQSIILYIDGIQINIDATITTDNGVVINFEVPFDVLKDENMKVEVKLESINVIIPVLYNYQENT